MFKKNIGKGLVLAIFALMITLLPVNKVYAEEIFHTTSSLYVRPSKNSKESLGIIGKNEEVVGEKEGAWFHFTFQGKEAYIASRFIEVGAAVQVAGEDFLGITKTSLYVRPSKNSKEVLGVLDKGQVVDGRVRGAWIQFSYEGQEAYIAKSLVREVSQQEAEQQLELNQRVYITRYASSDVYIRPSMGSQKSLGILSKAEEVYGYEKGAWFAFEYDGQTAYVAKSLLTEEKPEVPMYMGVVPQDRVVRTLTVQATAYTHTGSRTASGVWPQAYHTVAVDPWVIPMGTWMYVEGYGYAKAEDTGGAINGNIIDVFFDTESECINWGRQYGLTVYILDGPPNF